MPISITILRAAGLSDTEILRVIEQQEIVDEAAKAKVREQTRERTRRWRERMRDVCDASPSSPASHKEERKEPKERRNTLTDVPIGTSVRVRDAKRPKVPLPADWNPVVRVEDAAELERFKDHARAKDAHYADWDAAWRNWLTSPYRKANGWHANGRPKETFDEQCKRLADACRERERELGEGLFRTPTDVGSRRGG